MAYIPPLNGGRINGSIGGNSTSAGGGYQLISTGTMFLAGGNNITLSQNANSVTILGGAGGAGGVALANSQTTYTSGTANLLEGGGAITIASTTGQRFNLSVPATSSLSVTGALSLSVNGSTVSIGAPAFSAGIASNSTVSNRIILAAGNNITLSQSTNASGATVSITAGGSPVFSAGTTSNSLGSIVFSNSNGVSFGLNGSTITASAAGGAGIALANSQTTYTSGTANLLEGGGAITIASTTGQRFNLSVPATSSLSATGAFSISTNGNTISMGVPAFSAGISTLGNTAGTTGTVSNQLILAGGNNITLSQSTGAGGNTITISAGGGGNSPNFSAGTTSNNLGSIVFSNSNGVSFGLNGSTITASAAGGAGGGINIAASNTTFTSGTVVMSNNGGALTISSGAQSVLFSVPATSSISVTGGLSVSTNGSTISLGMAPMSNWMHNSAAVYSSSTSAMVNTSVSLVRMLIPSGLSFSRVDIPVSVSGATSATANTAAMALSAVGVIYSRSGSTLNPIIGQSSTTTYSYASNSGVYSSITGPRVMSFNLATSLSAGEYYFGFQMSSATSSVGTATTNLGWTLAPIYGTSYTVRPFQEMSAATNASINLYQPLQGMNSVSISNTAQTHQQSQITQSGATAVRANLIVMFRNN